MRKYAMGLFKESLSSSKKVCIWKTNGNVIKKSLLEQIYSYKIEKIY
jgi:hypothetical protein